MTREALLNVIGGEDVTYDRSIDVFVARARRAFKAIDPNFDQLHSVRMIGYRWEIRDAVPLSLVA